MSGLIVIIIIGFIIFFMVKVPKIARDRLEAEVPTEVESELRSRAELIGAELTKNGYKLTYNDVRSVGDGDYHMYVDVYKDGKSMGKMIFGTYGPTSNFGRSTGYTFALKHARDRYKIDNFNHIIHLDKSSVLIESEVPCSEPPPEWLKICGQTLRSIDGCTISYPGWMSNNNCPDASKYVNVVFQ